MDYRLATHRRCGRFVWFIIIYIVNTATSNLTVPTKEELKYEIQKLRSEVELLRRENAGFRTAANSLKWSSRVKKQKRHQYNNTWRGNLESRKQRLKLGI